MDDSLQLKYLVPFLCGPDLVLLRKEEEHIRLYNHTRKTMKDRPAIAVNTDISCCLFVRAVVEVMMVNSGYGKMDHDFIIIYHL